jgi:UDP:flavonoid glycosyltransferase YjiC (YdhE family)
MIPIKHIQTHIHTRTRTRIHTYKYIYIWAILTSGFNIYIWLQNILFLAINVKMSMVKILITNYFKLEISIKKKSIIVMYFWNIYSQNIVYMVYVFKTEKKNNEFLWMYVHFTIDIKTVLIFFGTRAINRNVYAFRLLKTETFFYVILDRNDMYRNSLLFGIVKNK